MLRAVWEAAEYPWSVRLKALLPQWMPWIRKRFRLRAEIAKQLLQTSPRQMDRRLRAQKTQRRKRLYGRTKPGYLLKTPHSGEDRSLGCPESGLHGSGSGSHSGYSTSGEFAHTLNVTDIHATWTESLAVLGRAEEPVATGLK